MSFYDNRNNISNNPSNSFDNSYEHGPSSFAQNKNYPYGKNNFPPQMIQEPEEEEEVEDKEFHPVYFGKRKRSVVKDLDNIFPKQKNRAKLVRDEEESDSESESESEDDEEFDLNLPLQIPENHIDIPIYQRVAEGDECVDEDVDLEDEEGGFLDCDPYCISDQDISNFQEEEEEEEEQIQTSQRNHRNCKRSSETGEPNTKKGKISKLFYPLDAIRRKQFESYSSVLVKRKRFHKNDRDNDDDDDVEEIDPFILVERACQQQQQQQQQQNQNRRQNFSRSFRDQNQQQQLQQQQQPQNNQIDFGYKNFSRSSSGGGRNNNNNNNNHNNNFNNNNRNYKDRTSDGMRFEQPPDRKRRKKNDDHRDKHNRRITQYETTPFAGVRRPLKRHNFPNMVRVNDLFDNFRSSEHEIGCGGLNKLREELGMNPKDYHNFLFFCLVYRLGCTTKFLIKRSEWCNGLVSMNCDELQKVRSVLSQMQGGAYSKWGFEDVKKFFSFVFRYQLDSPQSRNLNVQVAVNTLKCLMMNRSPFINDFSQFVISNYRYMNLDQFKIFVDFSYNIKPDFSNYDIEEGAWPTMYDEFYIWRTGGKKEKKKMDVSSNNESYEEEEE